MEESRVYQVLKELSIEFIEFRHPPVYTVEEAEVHWKDINAIHFKNLFFRDKKGRRHFLVVIRHNRQLDIRKIGEDTGAGRLSFASEQRLNSFLGLTPGSVSPFGLINDLNNQVEVLIDKGLEEAGRVAFHPNNNRITITLTTLDFKKYLEWTGNSYKFIDM